MDDSTDDAVAKAIASACSPYDAEIEALRAFERGEYRRRLVQAAGIDPATLSEQGRRIFNWLTEWDDWTIGGLVEILDATRTTAQDLEPGPTASTPQAARSDTGRAIVQHDERLERRL